MIDTVTRTTFIDTFKRLRPFNFSYEGLDALFDYFEQLEDDLGEQIEFDPIAICCEWSEYDNLQEVINNYDCIESLDDLYNHTQVIEVYNLDGTTKNGRLIIQDF